MVVLKIVEKNGRRVYEDKRILIEST